MIEEDWERMYELDQMYQIENQLQIEEEWQQHELLQEEKLPAMIIVVYETKKEEIENEYTRIKE